MEKCVLEGSQSCGICVVSGKNICRIPEKPLLSKKEAAKLLNTINPFSNLGKDQKRKELFNLFGMKLLLVDEWITDSEEEPTNSNSLLTRAEALKLIKTVNPFLELEDKTRRDLFVINSLGLLTENFWIY